MDFRIYIFMDKFMEPLYRFFMSWDKKALAAAAVMLLVIMTADYLRSVWVMCVHGGMRQAWKIDTSRSGLYRALQRLRGQTQSGGKIAG